MYILKCSQSVHKFLIDVEVNADVVHARLSLWKKSKYLQYKEMCIVPYHINECYSHLKCECKIVCTHGHFSKLKGAIGASKSSLLTVGSTHFYQPIYILQVEGRKNARSVKATSDISSSG